VKATNYKRKWTDRREFTAQLKNSVDARIHMVAFARGQSLNLADVFLSQINFEYCQSNYSATDSKTVVENE